MSPSASAACRAAALASAMSAPLIRSSAPSPRIFAIFSGEQPAGTTTTLRTPIRPAAYATP